MASLNREDYDALFKFCERVYLSSAFPAIREEAKRIAVKVEEYTGQREHKPAIQWGEQRVMTVTPELIKQFHRKETARHEALTEILCSAYKDATGVHPSDRLREKLFDAIRSE